ncbi:STM3941 family protein [Sphingobacterium endophyticum]|uniref:STM3941 family protein n=1 Tax=Sphingobacterium endophyticum TaxID=2546448 RepID=UPI0012E2938C|nr:STM3941 family protein [Sphingobacterium endophyticum]
METKNFFYGKEKMNALAIKFLLLGIAGLIGIYYIWFVEERIYLIGRVVVVFLALLGIGAFIYLKLFGKKPNEIALSISPQGIKSNTTPVLNAADLIEWTDITNVFYVGNTIDIEVIDPNKYADRMKNFFVRDTYMKAMKGIFRISLNEVNAPEKELAETLNPYLNKLNN